MYTPSGRTPGLYGVYLILCGAFYWLTTLIINIYSTVARVRAYTAETIALPPSSFVSKKNNRVKMPSRKPVHHLPDADGRNEPSVLLCRIRNMWQFANFCQWIYIFGKAVKIDESIDIDVIAPIIIST